MVPQAGVQLLPVGHDRAPVAGGLGGTLARSRIPLKQSSQFPLAYAG